MHSKSTSALKVAHTAPRISRMTPSQVALQNLRHQVRSVMGQHQRETHKAPQLNFEIPQGILVGLSGSAKTEWVARFLAHHPNLKTAWIEDKMTIYPCALEQRQVALRRILFAEAGKEMLWTAQKVLKSNLFQCVVTTGLTTHDRALRRLQMMAEKAQATVFLLNDQPYPCWPVAVKLHIEHTSPEGPLAIQVLKRRV